MNKLQRYWAEESGIYGLTTDDCDMGETCRLVCKDTDVSALEAELAKLKDREQRLKDWIDKVDDEIGWNHENDEIGQAVEAALTTVVKQFCTAWSEVIDSCPVCGSGGSCKHRKQRKQRASKHAQEKQP